MRFSLLDRIELLVPGERIEAIKALSLAEEYLADHFPAAPVMPGVLMLEATIQASAWLLRASQSFEMSVVTLKSVKGAKYASFVEPGSTLRVASRMMGQEAAGAATGENESARNEHSFKFKAEGRVNGTVAVSSRLVLTARNLSDAAAPPESQDAQKRDEFLISRLKNTFALLYPPGVPAPSN